MEGYFGRGRDPARTGNGFGQGMWRRCSLGFSGAAAGQELVGGAPDESIGDAEQHGDDAAAWIPPGASTLAMRPNTIQLSIPILASRAAGVDLSLMCTSLRMCLIPYPETGLGVCLLSKIRNLSDTLDRMMWQHSVDRARRHYETGSTCKHEGARRGRA